MENGNNYVALTGVPCARPVFSHAGVGGAYFLFPLEVRRLSGTADVLNIVAGRDVLEQAEITEGNRMRVEGELRSFNNRSGVGNRLVITVFARSIGFTDEEDANAVALSGTLCRRPNLRSTPMGREICDLMVAVNRRYGRSDYLPCIAWGRMAEEAAAWETGTRVDIRGRLQSRRYIKVTEEGQMEKTAFEVSVAAIGRAGDTPEQT